MRKLFSICAALLSLAAMPVIGIAQTDGTQISITPTTAQKVITGAPDRFTGSVRVQSLFDAKEPAHSSGGQVTFQPGARSAWHTHPLGQVLIVTDGVGWVQQWGGPVRVIRKGDVVWIPAGVKHWHGATPNHHHDAHRIPGAIRWESCGLVGKGHGRPVPTCEVRKQ